MITPEMYTISICEEAKNACRQLALATTNEKNALLNAIADEIIAQKDSIIVANKLDLSAAIQNGVSVPMQDRLLLNEERIDAMAKATRDVAKLSDPCKLLETIDRPNGLAIQKYAVPLGVVAMIYEARPNVTLDAAVLCFKSGNACVLRGGKEALNTNRYIVRAIKSALEKCGYSPNLCGFLDTPDRKATYALYGATDYVDVLIPRGSASLINSVKAESKVPVIETGAGNCHLYIDGDCDLDMALKIAINAKLSRPSVCNAIETILVHKHVASQFIPMLVEATKGELEIRADKAAREIDNTLPEATKEDFATEYDNKIVALGIVDNVESACEHINRYSTQHSEAIVTKNDDNATYFVNHITSACVYVNASTRFTDGGEFGFGAEIGISTQKLHVRGPMGLSALTTIQYRISGSGQIR